MKNKTILILLFIIFTLSANASIIDFQEELKKHVVPSNVDPICKNSDNKKKCKKEMSETFTVLFMELYHRGFFEKSSTSDEYVVSDPQEEEKFNICFSKVLLKFKKNQMSLKELNVLPYPVLNCMYDTDDSDS